MLLRRLFLALYLLCCWQFPASAAGVWLVLSDERGAYQEFATTLKTALEGSHIPVRWSGNTEAFRSAPAPGANDLIISAGADASQAVLQNPSSSTPILATLISRFAFEQLPASPRNKLSALYLDQPALRQFQFLRLLLGDKRRITLLHSPQTYKMIGTFRQAASDVGFTLETEEVNSTSEVVQSLNRLMPRNDALLGLPDPKVFNGDTARSILLTTLRHKKPLIGFSPAYISSGALAAIYSTPAQLARQSAEIAKAFPSTGLGAPQFPSYFAININRHVAHSLELELPAENVILGKLGMKETP